MLFETLKSHCPEAWDAYIRHAFVRRLAAGSLPLACFRHYLKQDYLFLVQFCRAYGLAVFKSRDLDEIRAGFEGLKAMAETEIDHHVTYCADWGLSAEDVTGAGECLETVAYSRFVLDCGLQGDLLDLHVALAPCIVGYAEIGRWLTGPDAPDGTAIEGNPYRSWIAMYAGEDYQAVAQDEIAFLDRLAGDFLPETRLRALAATFETATRLEIDFWEMGLNP